MEYSAYFVPLVFVMYCVHTIFTTLLKCKGLHLTTLERHISGLNLVQWLMRESKYDCMAPL